MTYTAFYPTLRQGRGVVSTFTRRWNQNQINNQQRIINGTKCKQQKGSIQEISHHRTIEDWDYAVLSLSAAWH
jgi:hypothetical protein